MSLDLDLKHFTDSVADSEEYQAFKSGNLKICLDVCLDRKYDYEYWCHNERLFLNDPKNGIKEIDSKLIPIVFFNPLFKRKRGIPYSEIFTRWRQFQENGKFKTARVHFINGSFLCLYELEDDCVIRYSKEPDGIHTKELSEAHMFLIFSDLPPEYEISSCQFSDKDQFFCQK